MRLSERARTIQASPIRKFKPYADQAMAQGIKVYFLNIGDPDIPTPRAVAETFHAYQDEVLNYGPAQGFLELRQAIADYFRSYNIDLNADNIIITVGGSEAIHFAFCVVADPGEEIIIPEPFYTNFSGFASYAALKIIPLTLRAEEGYHLPPAKEIEKLITPRTRAIVLCSPNNPTGTVYSREELEVMAYLAKKYDLFLIGDEVYKEFVYDGLAHVSLFELNEVRDRVIVADSISKRFSCCGARIGAVMTRNEEVYQALLRFAQARLCPPTVEQRAALAAYRLGRSYFEPIRKEYEKRRDILYQGLIEIPGVILHKPQGAFYINVKLPIDDSDKFVYWLLTEFRLDGETVMVAPGSGFYATPGKGKDEVRLAYVLKEKDLRRALELFKVAIEKYPGRRL